MSRVGRFSPVAWRETTQSHNADWRDTRHGREYIGSSTGWYPAPPCEPEWEEVYPDRMVYVIHARETCRVKIGSSINPLKRLAQMQTGSPERLELVRVLADASEGEIHSRFATRRLHGEWFEDSVLNEI